MNHCSDCKTPNLCSYRGCEQAVQPTVPRTVSVVESSVSRWYAPRVHVVVKDEWGMVEEIYQDCTVWEALAFTRYYEKRGWQYER